MADDLVRHFYGGFVRMHILYHAAKEPIWGVEMMKELRRHGYKLGRNAYPILQPLGKSGFLASQPSRFPGNGARLPNHPRGRKLLRKAEKRLRELVSEVL